MFVKIRFYLTFCGVAAFEFTPLLHHNILGFYFRILGLHYIQYSGRLFIVFTRYTYYLGTTSIHDRVEYDKLKQEGHRQRSLGREGGLEARGGKYG